MRKIFINLLCLFIPFRRLRHHVRRSFASLEEESNSKIRTIKYDIKNLITLVCFLLKKRSYRIEEIKTIHSLTQRVFSPEGGNGGPSAVLTCQKLLLGDNINGVNLKYTFFQENKFTKKRHNNLWYLYSAVKLAIDNTKKEKETAYITHDYGSAFGLYLMGKKYVHIYHSQGASVEEKINLGEKFSFISRRIIQFCEKKVFENAFYICFPSNGAYEMFCNSKYTKVKKENFKKGSTLYNTLYVNPESIATLGINKEKSCTTILSIGALTIAKGINKVPLFLEELLKQTNKNIRWIVVGNGPFYEEIKNNCESLSKRYKNFSYEIILGCKYEEIQYLQDISDVYLMLHSISIFDLATLEVMRKGKVIVLSNVGGNPEFNKNDNIILDNGDYSKTAKILLNANFEKLQTLNKECFNKYFSNDKFKERYIKVIKDLISND